MNAKARICFLPLATALLLLPASALPILAEDPPAFLLRWGTGGSGDGQFANPQDIAASGDGFVYVADTGNHRVQKFTADSVFVLKWGPFDIASGIAVDPNGNVYVADGSIKKFDANGNFLTSWNGTYAGLLAVAADPSGAFIYATSGLDSVIKFSPDGQRLLGWKVPCTAFSGCVYHLAVGPSGHVYVRAQGGVYKYLDGSLVTSWDPSVDLGGASGLAVDKGENVYVTSGSWIGKYTSTGTFLTRWGSMGSTTQPFDTVTGIAVDADGNVYGVEQGLNYVEKFGNPPTATINTTWGRIKDLYRR